ncbi:hypothetical protein M0R45_006835 [Rubus argutus]|uniref:Uncharacterized protein n=1 Tax=Rubus argutus TaxID=59490 RepID=A0AAW1YRS3_RUBAR
MPSPLLNPSPLICFLLSSPTSTIDPASIGCNFPVRIDSHSRRHRPMVACPSSLSRHCFHPSAEPVHAVNGVLNPQPASISLCSQLSASISFHRASLVLSHCHCRGLLRRR